jgi:hypothetical protein
MNKEKLYEIAKYLDKLVEKNLKELDAFIRE